MDAAEMKIRLRFSVRVLLLMVVVATIPSWWIATEMSQYRTEQSAVRRIRTIAPDTHAAYTDTTPSWLRKLGIRPMWMNRVDNIDVTGTTAGKKVETIPLNFDDAAFDAIYADLQTFEKLDFLYFQLTRLSDSSVPKLQKFNGLKFINLQQTAATSDAVKKLEAKLPNTTIAFFHDLTNPWQ